MFICSLLYLAIINQGTFLFSVCYYVSYAICIKFHRKKKRSAISVEGQGNVNIGGRFFVVNAAMSQISAHPLVWAQSKVQRPWALFRETTVQDFSASASPRNRACVTRLRTLPLWVGSGHETTGSGEFTHKNAHCLLSW